MGETKMKQGSARTRDASGESGGSGGSSGSIGEREPRGGNVRGGGSGGGLDFDGRGAMTIDAMEKERSCFKRKRIDRRRR